MANNLSESHLKWSVGISFSATRSSDTVRCCRAKCKHDHGCNIWHKFFNGTSTGLHWVEEKMIVNLPPSVRVSTSLTAIRRHFKTSCFQSAYTAHSDRAAHAQILGRIRRVYCTIRRQPNSRSVKLRTG